MSLRAAAIAYAKMGLKVFPLGPRSKKPTSGAHGLLDATSDPSEVEQIWTANPNANIGCNAGESNLAVLDVDLYKPGVEERLETLIENIDGMPDTWMALTGGGGHQYFFSKTHIDNKLRSGADCFGEGIDFKADGGYVVLPPSIHPSGKKYEWELSSHPYNSEIAPLPRYLADKRERKPPAVEPTPEPPSDVSAKDIADALTYVPAENYDHWIEVGMGLKAGLGESGFPIWDDWSRGSTKYDADEMRAKWNSFSGSGITVGSIYHYANENGWQPPRLTREEFEEMVKDWGTDESKGFPVILAARIIPKHIEWIVEKMVAVSQCGFMTGQPGTHKSWAVAEMLVAVASGDMAFGTLSTQQGTVLAFNAEDDPAIITRERLDRLARGRNLSLDDLPIYLVDIDTLRLDKPEDVARLRISVEEIGAKLLVLDPLRNLHWVNEDSSTEMAPVLAGVRHIQRTTGCSVLLVHHDRKGQGERRESRVRGSNSLEGWRDFALYMDAGDGTTSVKPYIKGCAPPAVWHFALLDTADNAACIVTTTPEEQGANNALRILSEHPDGLTKTQWAAEIGGRKSDALSVVGYAIEHSPSVVGAPGTITRGDGKPYTTIVFKLSDWAPIQSSAVPLIKGGTTLDRLVPGTTLNPGTT